VAIGTPTFTNRVAPGDQAARTGVRPGSATRGTSTAMRSGAAKSTRAGAPPTDTPASAAGTGTPSPRSHSRAPASTPGGSMPVSVTAGNVMGGS
jgi:hypothetical protein